MSTSKTLASLITVKNVKFTLPFSNLEILVFSTFILEDKSTCEKPFSNLIFLRFFPKAFWSLWTSNSLNSLFSDEPVDINVKITS